MKFRFISLLILLGSLGFFHGQIKTSTIERDFKDEITDSLLNSMKESDDIIFPKTFPENYKNKYQSKEFDYTATQPKESLWEKINYKFFEFLESIFGKINPNKPFKFAESVMRIFAVIIIGLVLYFLIKFLLLKDGNFFFSRKNKKINIEIHDLHENIHEINFRESIKNYEKNEDFRYAVRYQFLWVLKILTDKNIIEWNPEKTNQDYIAEIEDKPMKQKFKEIVKIFDYVWYGEFEINENSYHEMKEKWQVFHEKI